MKFWDLPAKTRFYDLGGRPFAVLPDYSHVNFVAGDADADCERWMSSKGAIWPELVQIWPSTIELSRDDFAAWLVQGDYKL